MYKLSRYFYLLRSSYHGKSIYSTTLSFSTTSTENPPFTTSFICDYLINTWGFSKDEAIPASIRNKHLKSLEKPKSVLEFLKETGFSETQIKSLISRQPQYLFCSVDKTLKPKLQLLQDLGFSGSAIADLIVMNPGILKRDVDNGIMPIIDFLRTFLRTDENIVRLLKGSSWFLCMSLSKALIPNVEILRRCGISDSQISWLILEQPFIFRLRPDLVEQVIARVKHTGIDCGSMNFVRGIGAFARMNEAMLVAKFDVFKSYGWSEEDILSAFRKDPYCLSYKESTVRAKMDFLLNEVGYQTKEIACRPHLLALSLEKRLMPRNEVLKILKWRGLLKRNWAFHSIANLSEKRFVDDYVLQYVDEAPDVQRVYGDCMDGVRQMKEGYKETSVSP